MRSGCGNDKKGENGDRPVEVGRMEDEGDCFCRLELLLVGDFARKR